MPSCLLCCGKGQGEWSRFMWPVKGVGWCSWPFENCLGRSGVFLHCCLVLKALLEVLILEFLFSDLTLRVISYPWGGRGPDANAQSMGGTWDPWPPRATAFHPVYLAASWLAPEIDGAVQPTAESAVFTPSSLPSLYENREGHSHAARDSCSPRGLTFPSIYICF